MLYPKVVALERSKDEWVFRITTSETIFYLSEAETKRLFCQLQRAFRPTPLEAKWVDRKRKANR